MTTGEAGSEFRTTSEVGSEFRTVGETGSELGSRLRQLILSKVIK